MSHLLIDITPSFQTEFTNETGQTQNIQSRPVARGVGFELKPPEIFGRYMEKREEEEKKKTFSFCFNLGVHTLKISIVSTTGQRGFMSERV